MKIILFYDITENKRLNKIRKVVTKYLRHIQYSVFEGELEKNEVESLKLELNKLINIEKDSIIIFSFRYFKEENKEILGINKNNFNGMVI